MRYPLIVPIKHDKDYIRVLFCYYYTHYYRVGGPPKQNYKDEGFVEISLPPGPHVYKSYLHWAPESTDNTSIGVNGALEF